MVSAVSVLDDCVDMYGGLCGHLFYPSTLYCIAMGYVISSHGSGLL